MWQVPKRSPVQFQVCLRQCHLSTVLHFVGRNLRSTCSLSRTTKISLSLLKSWRKPWKSQLCAVVGLCGMSIDRFDVTWSRCLLSFAHFQYHVTTNTNITATTTTITTTTTNTTMLSSAQFTGKNYVCTNSPLFAPSKSPRAIASLPRNISCLEIPDDQGMPNYELVFCPFCY